MRMVINNRASRLSLRVLPQHQTHKKQPLKQPPIVLVSPRKKKKKKKKVKKKKKKSEKKKKKGVKGIHCYSKMRKNIHLKLFI